MATTDEELNNLQSDIDAKKKALEKKQRIAAEMQRLIQNDQTKTALSREAENLDAQLAQADEHLKALEEASGVSANSIELRVTRGTSPQVASAIVAPAPTQVASESTDPSADSSAKRGPK